MYMIYILIAVLVMMARKPRRKRAMGRYIRGNVDETFALGTLGAKTAILKAITDTVNERTLVSSVVFNWAMRGLTQASGDGPIMVGIAHGDYVLSEIEAWIEQSTGWDETNLVGREIAQRKIRRIGIFTDQAGVNDPQATRTLNDGAPVKTKLNWILTQGQTLSLWAYNMGGSALATTDPDILVQGHANLFPK